MNQAIDIAVADLRMIIIAGENTPVLQAFNVLPGNTDVND
jgi:hypothetical protein